MDIKAHSCLFSVEFVSFSMVFFFVLSWMPYGN
jgi:hypothetical protein